MPFQMSDSAYNNLLESLNNLHFTEKNGHHKDLAFLADDWWLGDTVVIELLTYRRGMWEIHLIFAHHKQPCKLLKRIITTTYCPKKAEVMAKLMRKLAAKDQRGTLNLNRDDYGFMEN